MIGGALVGTFLGILVSYGFVAPIAGQLEQKAEEGGKIYQCIKVVLLASMNGYAPAGGGRIRSQGALLDRPADLHRTGRRPQGPQGQVKASDSP